MNMSSDRETTMLWKVEPLSPSGTPPLDIDDEWLSFDEKPAIFESNVEESALYEEQLTRAQVASKFLEELELKTWIKEESFADWLEEKIDLPIFEELPVPECGQNRAVVYPNVTKPQLQQHPQQHVDTTQTLLREFETVLGDVEACHQINSTSTLTPPQSPPPIIKQQQQLVASLPTQTNTHLLVSLQPLHQTQAAAFVYEQQHQQHHEESVAAITSAHGHHHHSHHQDAYTVSTLPLTESIIEPQIAEHWSAENLSLVPLVQGSDVAHELAKVDEYVRSCAEDVAVISGSSSSISSSSPPSPCTSSNASCISSEDSADPDDPDWSYESAASTSTGSGRRASTSQSRAGRRAKPYSRPSVEDKRVRKKEQNKNAATRYRQKKKQEIKQILGEEQELANRNEKLQTQVKDLQREIGYLKGLMRDLFKAKGLIK
jgi:cyclic AMP-dependent transcription factor ATF-4